MDNENKLTDDQFESLLTTGLFIESALLTDEDLGFKKDGTIIKSVDVEAALSLEMSRISAQSHFKKYKDKILDIEKYFSEIGSVIFVTNVGRIVAFYNVTDLTNPKFFEIINDELNLIFDQTHIKMCLILTLEEYLLKHDDDVFIMNLTSTWRKELMNYVNERA